MRLLLILVLFSNIIYAQHPAKTSMDSSSSKSELIGTWVLDLRPTPNSESYEQILTIHSLDEDGFKGEFYGSKVQNGLVNANWDKLYLGFQSSDRTNAYFHTAYLEGDTLIGITYCPKRNFVMPWRGKKKV